VRNLKPEDIVALILGSTLGLFIIALTIHSMISDREMSDSRADVLADLLTAFTNIISMYVGYKLGKTN